MIRLRKSDFEKGEDGNIKIVNATSDSKVLTIYVFNFHLIFNNLNSDPNNKLNLITYQLVFSGSRLLYLIQMRDNLNQ